MEPLRNGRGKFTLSPDTARRRDRAVQLRAQGWTYARIAEEVGYASAASALKAINAALAAIPQSSCEELVRQEEAKLDELDSRLAAIASSPPVRTTSIGRTQWDVRTCTCSVKAATNRDHEPGCEVQPVLDMSVVIAAMKERRQVGESLRKMRGADRPPPAAAFDPDQLRQIDEIRQEQARRIAAGTTPAELPRPAWHAEQRDGAWQIITDDTGDPPG
jgi:hypothetical protein